MSILYPRASVRSGIQKLVSTQQELVFIVFSKNSMRSANNKSKRARIRIICEPQLDLAVYAEEIYRLSSVYPIDLKQERRKSQLSSNLQAQANKN